MYMCIFENFTPKKKVNFWETVWEEREWNSCKLKATMKDKIGFSSSFSF